MGTAPGVRQAQAGEASGRPACTGQAPAKGRPAPRASGAQAEAPRPADAQGPRAPQARSPSRARLILASARLGALGRTEARVRLLRCETGGFSPPRFRNPPTAGEAEARGPVRSKPVQREADGRLFTGLRDCGTPGVSPGLPASLGGEAWPPRGRSKKQGTSSQGDVAAATALVKVSPAR